MWYAYTIGYTKKKSRKQKMKKSENNLNILIFYFIKNNLETLSISNNPNEPLAINVLNSMHRPITNADLLEEPSIHYLKRFNMHIKVDKREIVIKKD